MHTLTDAERVALLLAGWTPVQRQHDTTYWQHPSAAYEFPRRWLLLPPGRSETPRAHRHQWMLLHNNHHAETSRYGDLLELLAAWHTLKETYP